MIELDDRRWEALRGAYGLPYDPRPVLRRLKAGCATEPDWEELWSQLHHQGDVGEASYASAPQLIAIQAESEGVDWNVYAMLSTIEIERHRRTNPPLPEWLAGDYRTAWRELPRIAARDLLRTDDPLALRAILGVLALAKGQFRRGTIIAQATDDEIDEWLEGWCAWSDSYSDEDPLAATS